MSNTRPLVARLRDVLQVRLVADQLDSATKIRRMMVERAEAADEIERLTTPAAPPIGVDADFTEEFVPADQWPKEIDEPVLLYVVHSNAKHEPDPVERASKWEAWCVGSWTDFNRGGWTWHGMIGTVTHVAPLPGRPKGASA